MTRQSIGPVVGALAKWSHWITPRVDQEFLFSGTLEQADAPYDGCTPNIPEVGNTHRDFQKPAVPTSFHPPYPCRLLFRLFLQCSLPPPTTTMMRLLMYVLINDLQSSIKHNDVFPSWA
jgi:hypothetical protein